EIALDLEAASAICPNCNLLIVEANSASNSDLDTGVNTAAAWPGVVAVSNSYGGTESSSDPSDTSYDHPGITITSSGGDEGFVVEFPAAASTVTAVGGTSLVRDSTTARGWTEAVWNTSNQEGTGSDCSKFESKPTWQADTNCLKRTVG